VSSVDGLAAGCLLPAVSLLP